MSTARELTAEQREARQKERDAETRREIIRVATKCAAAWAPIGVILLVAMMYFLKPSLTVAGEFITEQAEYATEPFMPLTLFALAGGAFGFALGFRMSQGAGVSGQIGMVICFIANAAVALLAGFASIAIFKGIPPGIAWVAYVCFMIAADIVSAGVVWWASSD